MKKIMVVVLIISLLSLCACPVGWEVYMEGMEDFHIANSEYGLTAFLLPYEDFHHSYPYTEGNYFYYTQHPAYGLYIESVLMYLRYEPETYTLAKAEAMDTLPLAEEIKFSYNGYSFTENLSMQEVPHYHFPECWNMFAYNDEKCELVFMGFYIGVNLTEKDKELLTFTDVGAFLAEYFSFYDFSPAEEADAGTGTTTANTNVPAQPDP